MAYVSLEQRKRFAGRRFPRTPDAANAWLAAEHPEVTELERISIMVTAGRYADANAALQDVVPGDAIDEVRLVRLRAVAAAALEPAGAIDVAAIGLAARDLPAEERRYQVVSAAWSQAWLSLVNGRPWRAQLAGVAKQFSPYPLPRWVRIAIAIQRMFCAGCDDHRIRDRPAPGWAAAAVGRRSCRALRDCVAAPLTRQSRQWMRTR